MLIKNVTKRLLRLSENQSKTVNRHSELTTTDHRRISILLHDYCYYYYSHCNLPTNSDSFDKQTKPSLDLAYSSSRNRNRTPKNIRFQSQTTTTNRQTYMELARAFTGASDTSKKGFRQRYRRLAHRGVGDILINLAVVETRLFETTMTSVQRGGSVQ